VIPTLGAALKENLMTPHIRPDKEGGCKYVELDNPNAVLVGEDDED